MFESAMDTFEFDSDFYECSRLAFNGSEDISFFSSNSPPSSPRPCPISPCRSDSMDSLSMENDFVDFNDIINKDKKPFSPARKRLNMDALANLNQSPSSSKPATPERHYLQNINDNAFGLRLTPSGTSKRSLCTENPQTPHNKRCRSENQPPPSSIFTFNIQPQSARKTVSIMNVLTSSSEMLRMNRL